MKTNEDDDIRKLATYIRDHILGVNGMMLVDNGGGLLVVPVEMTAQEWELEHGVLPEGDCPPKDEPPETLG